MSDIFIGEILILLLLLPVIIRPFFRSLQWMQGLAILPLVTLLCQLCIVAAFSMRISFLPVVVLLLLVFLANTARLFRFLRSLPTDWFGITATIIHGLLVICFILVTVSVFFFRPESSYIPAVSVEKTGHHVSLANGIQASFTVWAPAAENAENSRKIVLYLPDPLGEASPRTTAFNMLAESGYTVIRGDFSGFYDYRSLIWALPQTRSFMALSEILVEWLPASQTEATVLLAKRKELFRLIEFARNQFGDVPLFLLAEGRAALAALELLDYDNSLFSGSVLLIDDAIPGHTVSSVAFPWDGDFMPAGAGSSSVFILTGGEKIQLDVAELSADDVLAAALLGLGRDAERKNAQRVARRIVTWFDMRRQYASF